MRLSDMKSLAELNPNGGPELPVETPASGEGDEEARADGIHQPEDFKGRKGYNRKFLNQFEVPFPSNAREPDEVQLDDGSGSELKYTHFSVVMSKPRKIAFYVACNINGAESVKTPRKGDKWFFDLRIPKAYQVGNDAYSNNKLDRGHLVRREDPVWGDDALEANADSFHYTNCSPQHKDFNQKIWLGLENYVLQNARDNDLKVSVFTGPVMRANDARYPGDDSRPVEIKLPKQYWKVVCTKNNGKPSATAYMLSQADMIEEDLEESFAYGPYKTYQVSLKRIEKLTKLDFGDLRDYDGFSGEEEATGASQFAQVETWQAIRI